MPWPDPALVHDALPHNRLTICATRHGDDEGPNGMPDRSTQGMLHSVSWTGRGQVVAGRIAIIQYLI